MTNKPDHAKDAEKDAQFLEFLVELESMGPQDFVKAVQKSDFEVSEIQAGFRMLNKQEFVKRSLCTA